MAQDHPARLAGAGPLDALRPRRHASSCANIRAGCSSSRCRWRRRTRSTTARAAVETAAVDDTRDRQNQEDGDSYESVELGLLRRRVRLRRQSTGTSATIPASRLTTATASNIRAAPQPAGVQHRPDRQARPRRANCSSSPTALDTAKPLAGVKIDAMSFQNQVLAERPHRRQRHGGARISQRQPFALIADDSGRKGYLRVANGVALPVSHFDVGGETVVDGPQGLSLRRPRRLAPGRSYLPDVRAAGPRPRRCRRTTRSRSSCAIRAASWCRR